MSWQYVPLTLAVVVQCAAMSWAAYRRAQARRAMRSLKGMLDAYRAGDYETALRFIDSMQGNRLIRGSATLRGGMLLNLGRIDEAEQCLREGIALKLDSKRMALAYSSLGQLLLERKRYNEAMQCFQTSLKHWPERGSTHRDIAEACLRRGANTAEAVKWARLAVTEDRATKAASPQAKESADINLGEDLATLAWAVAADSRDRDEVDRLVDEALPLVRNVVPVTARVRCYAGHAYQALGDSRNSEYHFDEAARIDPHGLWGRSARAAATLV